MPILAADYNVLAIEGDDIFGPDEAEKMRLPFDVGWEMWAVVHNNDIVMLTQDYASANKTCLALNNMRFFHETRH